VAQWVKGPVLQPLRHRSQLQLGFDPWPGDFHVPLGWPKFFLKEPTFIEYLICTSHRGVTIIIPTFKMRKLKLRLFKDLLKVNFIRRRFRIQI